MPVLRKAAMFLGPALGAIVAIVVRHQGLASAAAVTAAVTVWCAIWWILEPAPLPVTALIPLALFPAMGVLPMADVSECYGNKIVLLMLGGFMISKALERAGAHQRIAVGAIRWLGHSSSRRVVWGFMTAAALVSMWISNSATAIMLLPVALAIKSPDPQFHSRLLLGIAYACSIGGIGTPIGTPPNLIFLEVYRDTTGVEVPFLQWMTWTVPVIAIMLPLSALSLTRGLAASPLPELPPLPPWRAEERRVLTVFFLAAILWVTRTQPWGGWSQLLHCPQADDATVALIATIALFVIPAGHGRRLLDWPTAAQVQWGVLLLFGGGLAIARAFVVSGLSESCGQAMAGIAHWPLIVTIGLICFGVTFLSEITSNTATANLLMPILASTAAATGVEAAALMVPATISVSYAFMLPVGTPPNAIVMAGGDLQVSEMVREGLILNLIGVLVVAPYCYWVFG